MTKKAVLYSSQTCGPCRALKAHLKHLKVDYEERDTANEVFQKEAFDHAGMRIVPVLVVDDTVVTGYNPTRLRSLFQ